MGADLPSVVRRAPRAGGSWDRAIAWRPPRAALVGLLFGLAAAFVAYLAMNVPVRNLAETPLLATGSTHQRLALIALGVVLAADVLTVHLVVRARRRAARPPGPRAAAAGIPAPLRIQGVPPWALRTTLALSGSALVATTLLGLPLWQVTLAGLVPWTPLFVAEGRWKYRHYGFFAGFLALGVLQVGHLGEHTTQVVQLLASGGDLTVSHGVFGQLDFEGVHFFWDSAVWVGATVLVYRLSDNRWLWISWVAASVHQVEHIYLFWINQAHTELWAHGGISGILGRGGVMGSPLERPYLHFAFNLLVVVPMLVGLWDEAGRVSRRELQQG